MTDIPFDPPIVFHKTRLVVDEVGTVGAAVSSVATMAAAAPPPPLPPFKFVADRPFWLLLRDAGTGAPIFLGYVAAPRG